jgi:RHS repeat-associated protein
MNGALVVQYGYTAEGRHTVLYGSLAGTLGKDNPFRYRGYVYDEETGYYYLRSRYYYSLWGRFLNADTLLGNTGAVLSHNMFAYCNNNPVNRRDPSGLTSGSPFEWDESPWYYSDVESLSQAYMIEINNGYKKNGEVSTQAVTGVGALYVPALDATLEVNWGSIGKYHLDISFPKKADREKIVNYFGYTMEEPGTLDEWKAKGAWKPVEAYLKFNGHIVAGSVNLALHSGSGKNATLNITSSGDICFYTYDSKQTSTTISSLVQKHRDAAVKAYEFARSMQYKDWIVKDR